MIKVWGRTIRSETHTFINSIWNKEELYVEWKGSIIVAIYNKSDKRDRSNYRGIPGSSTTYKMLSSIAISRLTPYAEEIIGDKQCGCRRKRLTTDHIFCIRHIFEKEWE
jgi:hypothetical protein